MITWKHCISCFVQQIANVEYVSTVKLGYNELGYNELSGITNISHCLVGSSQTNKTFSRL
jgi:hypothetical protein